MSEPHSITVRQLGRVPYNESWQAMQDFTEQRDETTPDEIWAVEHSPVFTLGRAAEAKHLLNPGDIPIVKIDRGGQVTYHGPGQIVLYTMLDLKRKKLGVRELVTILEQSMTKLLEKIGIAAAPRRNAPGVYLTQGRECGAKIGAIGLRIKRGRSFHGLSLNIDMDLSPFLYINPCGYAGLAVSQVSDQISDKIAEPVRIATIERMLIEELMTLLNYEQINYREKIWSRDE